LGKSAKFATAAHGVALKLLLFLHLLLDLDHRLAERATRGAREGVPEGMLSARERLSA
jgi:hypothetical protein